MKEQAMWRLAKKEFARGLRGLFRRGRLDQQSRDTKIEREEYEVNSIYGFRVSFPLSMSGNRMLAKASRVRHDVFCTMTGWEKQTDTKTETDNFDNYSHHFGVMARVSNKEMSGEVLLSYLRLVDGKKAQVLSETKPVPMLHAGARLSSALIDRIKEGSAVEVSRFCMNPLFTASIYTPSGHRVKATDLNLLAAWHECRKNMPEVKSFVAILEPWLCKRLRSHGVDIKQVGDAIEHRGTRIPIEINLQDIRNRIVVCALKYKFNKALGGAFKSSHDRPHSDIMGEPLMFDTKLSFE